MLNHPPSTHSTLNLNHPLFFGPSQRNGSPWGPLKSWAHWPSLYCPVPGSWWLTTLASSRPCERCDGEGEQGSLYSLLSHHWDIDTVSGSHGGKRHPSAHQGWSSLLKAGDNGSYSFELIRSRGRKALDYTGREAIKHCQSHAQTATLETPMSRESRFLCTSAALWWPLCPQHPSRTYLGPHVHAYCGGHRSGGSCEVGEGHLPSERERPDG